MCIFFSLVDLSGHIALQRDDRASRDVSRSVAKQRRAKSVQQAPLWAGMPLSLAGDVGSGQDGGSFTWKTCVHTRLDKGGVFWLFLFPAALSLHSISGSILLMIESHLDEGQSTSKSLEVEQTRNRTNRALGEPEADSWSPCVHCTLLPSHPFTPYIDVHIPI